MDKTAIQMLSSFSKTGLLRKSLTVCLKIILKTAAPKDVFLEKC